MAAEYVDRDALREELYEADAISMRGAAIISRFPTADVVPVRHGRWIVDDFTGIIKCSECDNNAPLDTTGGGQWRSPFCPLCGSLMYKEKDGDGE